MDTKLPSSQAGIKTISLKSDNIAGGQSSPTAADVDNGEGDVDSFFKSHLTEPSKYEANSTYRWLFNLLKITSTIDPDTLQNAPLHSCFPVVDKESKLAVIIRNVHKTTWEVLDKFGESVFETMDNHGDKGIVDHWGT
jgi:hypothetical protein